MALLLLACRLFSTAAQSADPCQPHGETNVLTGECWGAGGSPGCFSCFYGDKCDQFNSSDACLVDASRNSFLLWQDYFESDSGFPPSTSLPASWAMPYQSSDPGGVVPPLDTAIRALHKLAGNANPDGAQLLACTGARGCALAVLYAMNKVYGPAAGAPLQVFSRAPYFTLYPLWVPLTSTGQRTDGVWNASTDPDSPTAVEILGAPNNPDGAPLTPLVHNKSRVICDHVYNWGWNHYPPVDLDCDVSVFSISKATGHCGTRVGWALIKDPRIFEAASVYNKFTAGGVSVEGQARSLAVIERILATNGSFFGVGRAILESRWDNLDDVLSGCVTSGAITSYNKVHRGPLLWLTAPVAKDPLAALAAVGIMGEPGVNFGGGPNTARVNLCVGPSDWALVVTRLKKLCGTPADVVWNAAARVDVARLAERSSIGNFFA